MYIMIATYRPRYDDYAISFRDMQGRRVAPPGFIEPAKDGSQNIYMRNRQECEMAAQQFGYHLEFERRF